MTGAAAAPGRFREPTAAPWLGRQWEHRQAAVAGAGSLAACVAYWLGTRLRAVDAAPGWIEFTGTMTSLWSVWITQRRNVLALPIGMVSVALMRWHFRAVGPPGPDVAPLGVLPAGPGMGAAWQDALYIYWDASIVAASIVAMVLMARKNVVSWWLWIGPVDVSAIGLYALTGAYMFAALYVVFLVMAFVGLVRWARAAERRSP